MAGLVAWVERSDREQRCQQSGSFVADSESVGLFLFRRQDQPLKMDAFFKRDRLAAHGMTEISNDCGESDGVSVCRRRVADGELVAAAEAQANQRPGRLSEGIALASVEKLRGIKVDASGPQVVFIYDDGSYQNPDHAVIRVAPTDRTAFDDIRTQIVAAFTERIPPRVALA